MDIKAEFRAFLNEGFNDKDITRKSIFFDSKGTMTIGLSDSEGFVKSVNWKDFKKSQAKLDASESSQAKFLTAVSGTLEFRDKVEFNTWLKKGGSTKSWEEKIDKLIDLGAKFSSSGFKAGKY